MGSVTAMRHPRASNAAKIMRPKPAANPKSLPLRVLCAVVPI
jgi:hypothetical protein